MEDWRMRTLTRIALVILALNVSGRLPEGTGLAAEKLDAPKAPAKVSLTVDRGHTALLVMDYQNDIVGMMPEAARAPLLDKASEVIKAARQAHLPILYIVVRFREGYPEIGRQNKRFAMLKESGRLREGTPGAEIHARVAPQPGDIVVTKRRVGAFSTTDLLPILRAKDITTLAMFGIATSGVVLSTVRWAADMDYPMIVVADACADMDAEIHRVLTEKVLPTQATVVSAQDFVQAVGAKEQKTGR
jgi:nicotinamidase-related amidase